jgi:hypothetical protein
MLETIAAIATIGTALAQLMLWCRRSYQEQKKESLCLACVTLRPACVTM